MIALAAALALFAAQEPGATVDDYTLQRQRIAALIADGDCAGAHGAAFVLADRSLLEWVEGACGMGAFDIARWDRYLPGALEGMFTEAQMRTARSIARGEPQPPVSTEPYEPAPDATPGD